MSKILEKITSYHSTSWTGIRRIIKFRRSLKKWPFITSCIFTIGICLGIGFLKYDQSIVYLSAITEISISVFPNLLGFSLGGYAIVVGFSNSALLESTAKHDRYSVYQFLNAIFALSLLFQILTLIVSFITIWCLKVDLSNLSNYFSHFWGNFINIFIFGIIFLGSLYSLLLTPYAVLNLFSLSQLNNLYFTKQRFKGELNQESTKQELPPTNAEST